MDYNKLAVFLRVCETKSFTQAAHSLRRTQSAVSQQVCLLEDDLGLSLIHRARGGLRLTAVGEALFETLRRSLGQIDDFVGDLTDRSSRASGEIRKPRPRRSRANLRPRSRSASVI